jgi:amino acid transporter
MAGKPDTRELAHEAIGSARLTAFGVSNVAPAGAVAGGLVIVAALAIGCVAALALMLGLPLTFTYGGTRAFGYLAGGAGLSMVLIYLAVNVSAIRAFRTGFRDDFRFCRHLFIPATAIVFLLFPLWGFFTRTAVP